MDGVFAGAFTDLLDRSSLGFERRISLFSLLLESGRAREKREDCLTEVIILRVKILRNHSC